MPKLCGVPTSQDVLPLACRCLPRGARAPRREPEERKHEEHEAVARRLDDDELGQRSEAREVAGGA